MKLVNLTPHAVTLLAEGFAVFDGKAKCYRLPSTMTPFVLAEFPSAGIARCAVEESLLGEQDVDGLSFAVPFVGVSFGEIEGLPAPDGDTVYIVSAIVANAARAQGRHDVVVPARMVRDAEGKILGCLAFAVERPRGEQGMTHNRRRAARLARRSCAPCCGGALLSGRLSVRTI